MTAPITATNPDELRQEAERLLAEGFPLAPALLLAITGAEPDFAYELTCEVPDCRPPDTGQPCTPVQTPASRVAALTLDGWQHFAARHTGPRVVARGWDTDDAMGTEPVDEWEYDTAFAATQTIGFDLTAGEHTARRRQQFWVSGPHLVVVTDTPEHGEALHTITPIKPSHREPKRRPAARKRGRR